MSRRKARQDALAPRAANYVPLSPLGFLDRAAAVFPERTAVIHGPNRYSWRQTRERCRRLAAALAALGVGEQETVAVVAPNGPPLLEAHFGVPLAGAVLNAINVRLEARTIAHILEHGEAKVLISDSDYAPAVAAALELLPAARRRALKVIDIVDPLAEAETPQRLGKADYEDLLAAADPDFPGRPPRDEWAAIALNYTSGTTGQPKGVVYHHRGAYLNALANAQVWSLKAHPVYLWTLPLYHCNGWCFPWTITALAGTHVCLRRVEGAAIYRAFAEHGVTHLCGAPIVMQLILGVPPEARPHYPQQVRMMTAAAAPPPPVLAGMAEAGIEVTHVYGLTEVYGPSVVCDWHQSWDGLTPEGQAQIKARQGQRYPALQDLMVADPQTLAPLPKDGESLGEVFMRGNIVMKGYLKDPAASERAFAGEWFHTGDLGVCHPDGYIELKDRAKDIIISGGENISSIEIENVLHGHPAVAAAAVVARPDETWGETPCAFIELNPGQEVDEESLIALCRQHLAGFKIPKSFVFGAIPRTSTGKIQKFALRERARRPE